MTVYLYDDANLAQDLSGGGISANRLNSGIDEFLTRSDSTHNYAVCYRISWVWLIATVALLKQ